MDRYTITRDGWKFIVQERTIAGNLVFDVTVIEPEHYHSHAQLERPVRFAYNAELGKLAMDSPQRGDFEELEDLLSGILDSRQE